MSLCRTSKINARTCVIAGASFEVLKAWMVFNRTRAPYYCPATNGCKLCLLFAIDIDFVLRPLFLMDRDCIENSRKHPG